MSKMAVPTMDVVRFQESDVITASINPNIPEPKPEPMDFITLAGFNNGTSGDATMNGNPISDFVRFISSIHGHSNVYFRVDGNSAVTAENLLTNEENNALKDGQYGGQIDGSGNTTWTWVKQ